MDILIIECPNCKCLVEIEQINCGIFRHAQQKNMSPINPHASKEEIEKSDVCNGDTVYE